MLRGSLWRLLAVAVAVSAATGAVAALKAGRSLHRDFDDGWVVELALDRETGSRLESKDRYLFGRFDLDIRLVAGMSAGTRDHRFLQRKCTWISLVDCSFVLVSDCLINRHLRTTRPCYGGGAAEHHQPPLMREVARPSHGPGTCHGRVGRHRRGGG
ncbi:unnamed protein product [Triticum turgidum subsp. durum]|uniref:GH16 domain-containing protein n=1 Tax=Triticum turgidum subsp. durum TaxID=4567 RepID=A0A9R0X4L5_TRITD|nr:unnamed protein product [Triticum turgidum subsp. durum]